MFSFLLAFTIKLKMPFRENAVLSPDLYKVKIARVLTDATTKDALQVSVDLINEGYRSREFSICVCNCPTACAAAAKTTVKKVLAPHIGETVTFLLPLIIESNHFRRAKIHCEGIEFKKTFFSRLEKNSLRVFFSLSN